MKCDVCGADLGPVPDEGLDLKVCACGRFARLSLAYELDGVGWLEPHVVRCVFVDGMTFRSSPIGPVRASRTELTVVRFESPIDPSSVTEEILIAKTLPVPFSYDELCGYVAAGKNVRAYLAMA